MSKRWKPIMMPRSIEYRGPRYMPEEQRWAERESETFRLLALRWFTSRPLPEGVRAGCQEPSE